MLAETKENSKPRARVLDENRIAEFVRVVLTCVEFAFDATQGGVVDKRPQQLVVAGARFVCARQQRVDDQKRRVGTNPLRRQAVTRRHRPSARPACSSARTTVVPTAMILARSRRARAIRCAVRGGISYGSSNGSSASSAGSPVEESPAACVSVANRTPRAFIIVSTLQSIAKPADGGSKATGGPAIGVQVSQSASECGTCAY